MLKGPLLPRGGRALVKRLVLGVSEVAWMTTFDLVVKTDLGGVVELGEDNVRGEVRVRRNPDQPLHLCV